MNSVWLRDVETYISSSKSADVEHRPRTILPPDGPKIRAKQEEKRLRDEAFDKAKRREEADLAFKAWLKTKENKRKEDAVRRRKAEQKRRAAFDRHWVAKQEQITSGNQRIKSAPKLSPLNATRHKGPKEIEYQRSLPWPRPAHMSNIGITSCQSDQGKSPMVEKCETINSCAGNQDLVFVEAEGRRNNNIELRCNCTYHSTKFLESLCHRVQFNFVAATIPSGYPSPMKRRLPFNGKVSTLFTKPAPLEIPTSLNIAGLPQTDISWCGINLSPTSTLSASTPSDHDANRIAEHSSETGSVSSAELDRLAQKYGTTFHNDLDKDEPSCATNSQNLECKSGETSHNPQEQQSSSFASNTFELESTSQGNTTELQCGKNSEGSSKPVGETAVQIVAGISKLYQDEVTRDTEIGSLSSIDTWEENYSPCDTTEEDSERCLQSPAQEITQDSESSCGMYQVDLQSSSRDTKQVEEQTQVSDTNQAEAPSSSSDTKQVEASPSSSDTKQVEASPSSSDTKQVAASSSSSDTKQVEASPSSSDTKQVEASPSSSDTQQVDEQSQVSDMNQVKAPSSSSDTKQVDEQSSSSDTKQVDEQSSSSDIKQVDEQSSSSDTKQVDEQSSSSDTKQVDEQSSSSDTKRVDEQSSSSDIKQVDEQSSSSDTKQVDEQSSSSDTKRVDEQSSSSDTKQVDEQSSSSDTKQVDEQSSSSSIKHPRSRACAEASGCGTDPNEGFEIRQKEIDDNQMDPLSSNLLATDSRDRGTHNVVDDIREISQGPSLGCLVTGQDSESYTSLGVESTTTNKLLAIRAEANEIEGNFLETGSVFPSIERQESEFLRAQVINDIDNGMMKKTNIGMKVVEENESELTSGIQLSAGFPQNHTNVDIITQHDSEKLPVSEALGPFESTKNRQGTERTIGSTDFGFRDDASLSSTTTKRFDAIRAEAEQMEGNFWETGSVFPTFDRQESEFLRDQVIEDVDSSYLPKTTKMTMKIVGEEDGSQEDCASCRKSYSLIGTLQESGGDCGQQDTGHLQERTAGDSSKLFNEWGGGNEKCVEDDEHANSQSSLGCVQNGSNESVTIVLEHSLKSAESERNSQFNPRSSGSADQEQSLEEAKQSESDSLFNPDLSGQESSLEEAKQSESGSSFNPDLSDSAEQEQSLEETKQSESGSLFNPDLSDSADQEQSLEEAKQSESDSLFNPDLSGSADQEPSLEEGKQSESDSLFNPDLSGSADQEQSLEEAKQSESDSLFNPDLSGNADQRQSQEEAKQSESDSLFNPDLSGQEPSLEEVKQSESDSLFSPDLSGSAEQEQSLEETKQRGSESLPNSSSSLDTTTQEVPNFGAGKLQPLLSSGGSSKLPRAASESVLKVSAPKIVRHRSLYSMDKGFTVSYQIESEEGTKWVDREELATPATQEVLAAYESVHDDLADLDGEQLSDYEESVEAHETDSSLLTGPDRQETNQHNSQVPGKSGAITQVEQQQQQPLPASGGTSQLPRAASESVLKVSAPKIVRHRSLYSIDKGFTVSYQIESEEGTKWVDREELATPATQEVLAAYESVHDDLADLDGEQLSDYEESVEAHETDSSLLTGPDRQETNQHNSQVPGKSGAITQVEQQQQQPLPASGGTSQLPRAASESVLKVSAPKIVRHRSLYSMDKGFTVSYQVESEEGTKWVDREELVTPAAQEVLAAYESVHDDLADLDGEQLSDYDDADFEDDEEIDNAVSLK